MTVLSPDLYNIYKKLDAPLSGEIVLTVSLLRLPEKCESIIFNTAPSTGILLLNNQPVILNDTEITKAQIVSGLLTWDTEAPDTSVLLEVDYFALDTDGVIISLLQVYYPPDLVADVSVNVIDGGNFNTGLSNGGVPPDGGDFDTAITVTNGYSYDGGDFNTGERVGIAPPPASFSTFYQDGQLDPEAQSIVTLLDENLQIIPTANLPNVQYFAKTVVDIDFEFTIDFRVEFQVKYVSKYFEGFDYGYKAPNFGYDIDYGTIENENEEGYDFNSIVNYTEPSPASGVSQ